MTDTSAIVGKPPLTWGSDAMIVELTTDLRVPQSVKEAGYEYIIEKEELENLLKLASRKRMTSRSTAELVIHYAITDSYPAWINDIPDA